MVEQQEQELEKTEGFPSTRFLVKLYAAGAITALVFSFIVARDPSQTTACLAISWICTSGALGMSVFLDMPQDREDPIE